MKKWAMLLMVGLFLLSCNSFSSLPTDTAKPPLQESTLVPASAPENTQPPLSASGNSPDSGSEKKYIHLPASPDVPPADVIQQIAVFGGGGGEVPVCLRNCVSSDENDNTMLADFQPNQRIRIVFYYYDNFNLETSCGEYKFLTEIALQTDSKGTLAFQDDGEGGSHQFTVLDEDGNILYSPENKSLCPDSKD